MVFFAVILLLQVTLIVHALKTGRQFFWVIILLMAPLIGAVAYIIVELLPEWQNSGAAHRARRKLDQKLNPDRDLHEAAQRYAMSATVQNAMRLAEQHLLRGQCAEARELYHGAARGLHADDPHLLLGLARAEFGCGDYGATLQTLETLKQKHPDARNAEGHLLYARALEQLGRAPEAIEEYEALTRYYSGPEPACRLARLLQDSGQKARALELWQKVVSEAGLQNKRYQTLHRDWIDAARRELA